MFLRFIWYLGQFELIGDVWHLILQLAVVKNLFGNMGDGLAWFC